MSDKQQGDVESPFNPAAGYLNVFYADGEYHIEMHPGAQSFAFAFADEDYESVAWYADQIVSAIRSIGGNCHRYGEDNRPIGNPCGH